MSKKKSYMNTDSIINEGILDKLLGLIGRGKYNKLRKKFKDNPKVLKKKLQVSQNAF